MVVRGELGKKGTDLKLGREEMAGPAGSASFPSVVSKSNPLPSYRGSIWSSLGPSCLV